MALKKILTVVAGWACGFVQTVDDFLKKFYELMSKIFLKEYKILSLVTAMGLSTQLLVYPYITP